MRIWIFLIVSTLGFIACNSDTPAEDVSLPQPPNREVTVPAALSSVFSPQAGVLRGVDFSMDRASVAANESANQVEADDNSLLYSVDLNEDEFVDVIYTFADDAVDQMELHIYAADAAAAANYYQNLEELFNSKYLKRDNLWDGSSNDTYFTVYAEEASDAENPIVFVFYERMDSAAAAVYKAK